MAGACYIHAFSDAVISVFKTYSLDADIMTLYTRGDPKIINYRLHIIMLPCMRGIHEDMLLFGHESESTLRFSLLILHNKRAGPIGYSHYNIMLPLQSS